MVVGVGISRAESAEDAEVFWGVGLGRGDRRIISWNIFCRKYGIIYGDRGGLGFVGIGLTRFAP